MSSLPIMQIIVRASGDVVLARQRAQAISQMANFAPARQTSFATALSEIARNALQFATEARIMFSIESLGLSHFLMASVIDQGPGISQVQERGGSWDRSVAFKGQGIASAQKLVKHFSINCPPTGGTTVKLGLNFPENYPIGPHTIASWTEQLAQQKPRNLLDEMQYRNQELVAMLEELQEKEVELERQVAADAVLKAALSESHHLLEARVAERTASLLISNEELRAFSYSVSHDLRAPLRAINGFVSHLQEEHLKPDDARGAELARRIMQSTEHMDALIRDLVAYTQVSKVPIPLQPVDSRELVEDLLKQCEDRFQPSDVHVQICGEFPAILANPAILHSALINLVENALKFRNGTGEAFITLRGTPSPSTLRLWVEDRGIGIAPEHHQRIFGVFERLHGREIPGNGIGLAMVKRWITGMHGEVGLESKVGEGARFWIELPLSA